MAETDIKQEDFFEALKQAVPGENLTRGTDIVSGRYTIEINQPLPEFDSAFAKAFTAKDKEVPDAQIYALVFDNTMPMRQKNITILREFRHPNMVALVGDGVAEISNLSEARYVAITEKPIGQPLSKLLSGERNPVPETILINHLLRPLVELLIALNAQGISHNRINLDTVYLSKNSIMLGECISEPSGFSQNPIFEPIDRLLASPFGKPDNAIGADCYALAILVLHLALGFQPFQVLDKNAVIDEILSKGAYHSFVIQWEFSDALQDFFRGLLNDTRREQWNPVLMESWLSGRKFNLILPAQPRETTRGFEFAENSYVNCKMLAHAFSAHWHEAKALVFDNKLPRWLDSNVHKPDLAQAVTLLTANDASRSERYTNELLARVIILLDSQGPIRVKNCSVAVESLGLFFASAFLLKDADNLQTITQLIEGELPDFWVDQQKNPLDFKSVLAKYQKVRPYLYMTGLGFGLERCLYEFFPDMPCQSLLIKQYHVTTLKELLIALDTIAPTKAASETCMDRHIAAFIACKTGITKEIRIREMENISHLLTNPQLIALKLLLQALQKTKAPLKLAGLSYWLASSLFPLLDHIHKRSLRRKLQAQLLQDASKGSLDILAELLLNPDIFAADYGNFRNAALQYAEREQYIALLKNPVLIKRHADMAGRGIALSISYALCLTIIYFTLRGYFHFL
jgi:hypothetical protein